MLSRFMIVCFLFVLAHLLIFVFNFKLFTITIQLLKSELKIVNKQVLNLEEEVLQLRHITKVSNLLTKNKSFFPRVKYLHEGIRKRVLVTGGAGFVGSHLVDRLMMEGQEVIALDNFFTGQRRNVEQWIGHPNFMLVHHDVTLPYLSEVNYIYHLASPASPPHYMYNPVKTLKTNLIGSINVLGLARRVKAKVLLASTSEVYGDPEVSPQPETYWGHVHSIGPRSCYDEGKRAAESLFIAYSKQEKVDIRIARIFNTFGPRMHFHDGRVVSNFITQALMGKSITIYGDGNQSRSFQYISDLIDGLISLMESNVTSPINIGNPEEFKIKDFAELVKDFVDSKSEILHLPAVEDDPQQRRPDIHKAENLLGWSPKELKEARERMNESEVIK